jgi:hypothetical protein
MLTRENRSCNFFYFISDHHRTTWWFFARISLSFCDLAVGRTFTGRLSYLTIDIQLPNLPASSQVNQFSTVTSPSLCVEAQVTIIIFLLLKQSQTLARVRPSRENLSGVSGKIRAPEYFDSLSRSRLHCVFLQNWIFSFFDDVILMIRRQWFRRSLAGWEGKK